ncbi:MAG: hypothetical protein AAF677_01910 [Pseudomonadota bacterium]
MRIAAVLAVWTAVLGASAGAQTAGPDGAPALEAHPVSALVAERGLSAAMATLDPAVEADAFALGALRFLAGVERGLATRWAKNIGGIGSLPLFRVPIATNPAPEPFAPGDVAALFDQLSADMAAARAVLAPIQGEVALVLDLNDLWFDIDGDGQRGPGEDAALLTGGRGEGPLLVRFDTADRHWLIGYTHLLAAFSELVLAFDPTDAIAAVGADRAALAPFASDRPMLTGSDDAALFDYLAIVRAALDQPPDAARLAQAVADLRATIAASRAFWTAVAAEDDDLAEWIPSDTQTAALGLTFPPGTGTAWLGFLAEIEAMLDGRLLVPHPFMAEDAGIDLATYAADPRPIDILSWLHGRGALPYLKRGEVMSAAAWDAFQRLVGRRDAFLFAAILN